MRKIVTLCLFLSGAAGLVDEVVWSRGVAVLLGSTASAHALTLAVFLGGLALGAALFGRMADRSKNLLRLYAMLELGVGVTAALTPAAIRFATGVFSHAAAGLYPAHTFAVGALKLGVACALLLPSTLLMGGTLPVVVRALVREGREVGAKVSLLYAANSAGGVLGSLASGLWMVPAVGLDRCAIFAATLNVLAAACALVPPSEDLDEEPSADAPVLRAPVDVAPRHVVLAVSVAMLASGFASLLYETLWIRILALVVGGTAHAFPLMLAAFITGITFGAGWAGRRERGWREALVSFAWVEVAAAATVALAFWSYQRLPYVDLKLSAGLARTSTGYLMHLVSSFGLSALVMMIPAAALGATLPLAAQVCAGEVKVLGRSFGNIYAWNTAGNVLGAVSAAHLVMPLLGLKGAFLAGGIVNALAGLWPLLAAREKTQIRVPALAAALATLVLVLTPFEPLLLAFGTFRWRDSTFASFEEFRSLLLSDVQVLFHEDGASATVEVHEYPPQAEGKPPLRSLRVNGKADASTGGDMQTQLLLGHLPTILHKQPKKVLVVGLGSGVSAAAALRSGSDVQVDVVEISPEVVRAAEHFRGENHDLLKDPRVHLVVDDARTFVRLSRETYDVVIMEPSNPWMPGISGLFTQAFFREVKERMAPGATLVVWSQFYETNDTLIRMVVRTFRSEFPDATAWATAGADMLLLAGVDPLHIDWPQVTSRMEQPEVKESLTRAHVAVPAALAALQMYSREGLQKYAGEGPLHTDEWPQLEYGGAMTLFLGEMAQGLVDGDERRKPHAKGLAISALLDGRELTRDEAVAVYEAIDDWDKHGPKLCASVLRRAAELDDSVWPRLARFLEERFYGLPIVIRPHLDEPPATSNPDVLVAFARDYATQELQQSSVFRPPHVEPAIRALEAAIAQHPKDEARAWLKLVQLRGVEGDLEGAKVALEQAKKAPSVDKRSDEQWKTVEKDLAALF